MWLPNSISWSVTTNLIFLKTVDLTNSFIAELLLLPSTAPPPPSAPPKIGLAVELLPFLCFRCPSCSWTTLTYSTFLATYFLVPLPTNYRHQVGYRASYSSLSFSLSYVVLSQSSFWVLHVPFHHLFRGCLPSFFSCDGCLLYGLQCPLLPIPFPLPCCQSCLRWTSCRPSRLFLVTPVEFNSVKRVASQRRTIPLCPFCFKTSLLMAVG